MNLRVSDRIRLKNDSDKSSSILSSPKLMASSKSLNNDYDESSFLSPSARRKVTIMSNSDNELSFISPSSKKKSLMLTDPKQIIKSNVTSKSITSTKRSLASDYNYNEAPNKLIESSPVKIKNETKRALWETSDTIFSPLNKRKCNKRMYDDDDDDDGSLQNYNINDIDVIKLQTEKNMVNNLLNASTEEEKLFICKKLRESWAGIKDVDDDNEEEEDDDEDDEDDYQNDNIENQYYRHLYLKESI